MVKTKTAVIASLISAVIIGIILYVVQQLFILSKLNLSIVGAVTAFLIAFIGMKYKK